MRLFDYAVKNDGPIRIALDQQQVQDRGSAARRRRHASARLGAHRSERRADRAEGVGRRQPRHPAGLLPRRARLGPRGAARPRSTARSAQPLFSGSATITDGRIRHFSLPNALDAINGDDSFRRARRPARRPDGDDGRRTRAVRRPDRVRRLPARRRSNVTVRGEDMHLRIPEGVRSIVDADLALRGTFKSPTLGGVVTVKSAIWTRRIDTPGSIFDFASRRSGAAGAGRSRRRGGDHAAAEVRRPAPGAVDAAGREQPGAPGRQRRPDAARHLRSAGRHRARRHRARRGDVRGTPLPHHARHRSTSRTRRGSSRSSTSRRRPTCASPDRPIG